MSGDSSGWPSHSVFRRNFLAATGATGAIGLAGCTRALSNEDDEVNIAGSSTVFPIAEAIASDFVQENPEMNVSVSQTGSGGGFSNFFRPGRTDLNDASRPIVDEERTQCSDNDIGTRSRY